MQKYSCKTCGAELYWNASLGKLKCDYCDSEFNVADFEDNTTNKDAKTKSSQTKIDGEEVDKDLSVYKCSHCGAEIVTSKKTMATTCAYCNRAISITDKSVGNFRPETIIPFSITKEEAIESFKKYSKSSILIPKTFQDEAKIQLMQGLYVPFFLHTLDINSVTKINADKIKHSRSGDDRITTTDTYLVKIDAQTKLEKIPVDASEKLNDELMDALEPFNYQSLAEYNPAYMAGFLAEQKDEEGNFTNIRAKERAAKFMKEKALEKTTGYDKKTFLSQNDTFSNESSCYTMLPVWLLNIEYKDELYQFAINGNTGKAVGKLPISKIKLNLFTLGSFAGINIITLILSLFL